MRQEANVAEPALGDPLLNHTINIGCSVDRFLLVIDEKVIVRKPGNQTAAWRWGWCCCCRRLRRSSHGVGLVAVVVAS
jgi:hypothetical protein